MASVRGHTETVLTGEIRVLKVKRRWPSQDLKMLVEDPDGKQSWVAEGDVLRLTLRINFDA